MESSLIRESLKGATPPHKEKRREYSGNLEMIKHWNNLALNPCKEGSNNYRESYDKLAKLRVGTMYNGDLAFEEYHNKKFTQEEIMIVFERFALASLHPQYLPTDKTKLRKLPLSIFIYNPFTHLEYARAHFLNWLNQEPILIEKEMYPAITSRLIKRYAYDIVGRPGMKVTERDRMKFVKAANSVRKFLFDNKVLQNLPFKVSETTIADWLFDAVNRPNLDKVLPGLFCCDYTFTNTLPTYLKAQGLMEKGEFKGRGL